MSQEELSALSRERGTSGLRAEDGFTKSGVGAGLPAGAFCPETRHDIGIEADRHTRLGAFIARVAGQGQFPLAVRVEEFGVGLRDGDERAGRFPGVRVVGDGSVDGGRLFRCWPDGIRVSWRHSGLAAYS